jgi:DNA adenine methylase
MAFSKVGADCIRPLIKWTGGKYTEYEEFSQMIPSFERYVEPFFGGGGVFFALKTQKNSCLNDKSKDLIRFYKSLSDNEFKVQSYIYADAWDQAGELNKYLLLQEANLFNEFLANRIDQSLLETRLEDLFNQLNLSDFEPLFNNEFILDAGGFKRSLCHSLADKFKRIRTISQREKRIFTHAELNKHFETGLKSGFYLYMRRMMNEVNRGTISLPPSKVIANWYFIREFCYGSMFRFNSKGDYNIPYGGIAYNRKKFRSKIEQLFSQELGCMFEKSRIENLDFEEFLNTIQLQEDDFIFLDPPYDSEFSEYDQNSFTCNDQVRLARFLESVPAKWMMIIKETPFIRSLYQKDGIILLHFNKNYRYNIRGRNRRDVKHLIILNYDPFN